MAVSVKEKADAARRVTALDGHWSGGIAKDGMAMAGSKIKALNAAGVFAPGLSGRWENGSTELCRKDQSSAFSPSNQLLIDFFRLYDNIPNRKSGAIPQNPFCSPEGESRLFCFFQPYSSLFR